MSLYLDVCIIMSFCVLVGDRDPVWVFTTHRRSPTSPGFSPNPSDEATPLNPITSLNTSPHDVKKSDSQFDGWMVSCDSNHNEGFSTAQLTTSPAGHGLFIGHLNTRVRRAWALHCRIKCFNSKCTFLQREMIQ